MKNTSLFLLLAALFFQSPQHGLSQTKTTAKNAALPAFDRNRYKIPHKTFVLDNGLTLIVHEDHNVPVVGVNFWYHVGSRNEQRGKTGFAHLFEHFFFNGSENYPHGFREAMDDLGANNRNGTTNTDRTNFFEDVPVSALERTLYLEADRMGFLAGHINKEMLERERGVVQNEKRQGENQPYGRVFSEIVQKVYPYSHPYSWSTIGSMEDLNAASLDDVKEWYKTYYGPNNAVLALAGDITAEKALELVTKYFGGIAPGPALTRTEKWVPKLDRNIRDEMQDRVPQTRIYRVYHLPEWKNKDLQYLTLFGGVLSGSKSARLDRRLVYEKQIATNVGSGVSAGELSSLFLVIVTLKPGADPLLAEKEVDAVMNELIEKGPSEEELRRVKNSGLADFLRRMEKLGGMGGRSDILAESMTSGGSAEAYLGQIEVMAKATPADVKTAAKTWLVANHYTMTVKPYPPVAAKPVKLDRSVLPALSQAPEVKFPAVQKNKLKNGLNVILLERHSVPIVNVTIAADAGFASDPTGKAGTASLAMDLMDEGTKTMDAFGISNQLNMLGATLTASSQLDLSLLRLGATSENLRPSLKILSDVVLNPSFPQDQFLLKKQLRISQIAQEKSQATGVALRILPKLLYGAGHVYGNPLSGSGYETSAQSIDRADLINWHSQWIKPGSSTVIVTGDVTMDKLMPALEEAFANWKPGTAPAKNIARVDKTNGGRIYLIDKPDAPQSTIIAAHVSEESGQPEDIAIQPVLQNFGGMATSRLNRNLRLDKHWSYGTNGALITARGQRPFVVTAPVQTDKTKEAMAEVLKEIKGVAGEREIAGEEYESIMRNMTLRLPARFSTLSALENAAIEMINYKLPDNYWPEYAGNVRRLTAPTLNESAKKFIRPSEIIWIVVGDLKKIETGIRALNYGEVILLDTDGKVMSR